jgi:ribosomal protein S18 acetylase RimI-like enzyme
VDLREYEPTRDREHALAIVRELLAQGPSRCTLHPGEWDWWVYHQDPRHRTRRLIGDGAIVEIGFDIKDVAAFGCSVAECIALGRATFPAEQFTISAVSLADIERVDELRAAGFEVDGEPMPLFVRPAAGADARPVHGFDIRPLAGEPEAEARADAARLAFASTLPVDEHRARYLRFMRSPGYVREHDIVAVDRANGTIAAFAIHWIDDELSLAQFEPVGTHPDYQRRGLASAVLFDSLARIASVGIATARVMTHGANVASRAAYGSVGFELVDQVANFRGR